MLHSDWIEFWSETDDLRDHGYDHLLFFWTPPSSEAASHRWSVDLHVGLVYMIWPLVSCICSTSSFSNSRSAAKQTTWYMSLQTGLVHCILYLFPQYLLYDNTILNPTTGQKQALLYTCLPSNGAYSLHVHWFTSSIHVLHCYNNNGNYTRVIYKLQSHNLHSMSIEDAPKHVLFKRVQSSRKDSTQLLPPILRQFSTPSEFFSVHRRLDRQGKYTWPHFQQSNLRRHSAHISGQSSNVHCQIKPFRVLCTKKD